MFIVHTVFNVDVWMICLTDKMVAVEVDQEQGTGQMHLLHITDVDANSMGEFHPKAEVSGGQPPLCGCHVMLMT